MRTWRPTPGRSTTRSSSRPAWTSAAGSAETKYSSDPGPEFVDVEPGGYYADAVDWLVDTGLTTGTSPTTFSPDLPVTRGQAAVFLWRHRGEPTTLPHPFVDVDAGAYHHDAVGWLAGAGITTETSATTFGPDEPLTRGQAATLLWRTLGEPEGSAVVPFVDVDPSRGRASRRR